MSAQTLIFPLYLQLPLEQGHLSPESAWLLEWELEQLQGQPWTPGVFSINQRVILFHCHLNGMVH
ncbi:MAG: hypothetical protein H7293_07150 [Candidatus Saccharibacteria bacterium]|nr:hypothetical protein [Rhodoferax sp.]